MQSDLEGASVEDNEEGFKSPKSSIESYKMSLDALDSGSGHHVADDVDDKSTRSPSNQLVPYNAELDTLAVTGHTKDCAPHKKILGPCPSSRTLPSIGAFAIQCAQCFKWRIIPSKEKYEALREHIIEEPFVCERACEWRPDISCEDPTDLSQDGTRVWAIDKPNISRPPPGWERLLRIRGEGSTKFADVYYAAPSGKRLRSMVEVQKYLLEHPEYVEQGVSLSQFSFQIPRPLQENYVRKRPARLMSSGEGGPKPPEPEEVKPLAWVAPTLGEPEAARSDSSAICDGKPAYAPSSDQFHPPAAKKKFQGPSTKKMYNNPTNHIGDHLMINLEDSEQSRSAPHDI